MSNQKKPYVKPEITIISPNSPKCKKILQPLERKSRGQRFNFTRPPPSFFQRENLGGEQFAICGQLRLFLRRRIRAVQLLPHPPSACDRPSVQKLIHRCKAAIWSYA